MFKLNKTHFNRELMNKIMIACRNAMKTGSVAHVENRKGHTIITVRHRIVGGRNMFELRDQNGDNIGVQVGDNKFFETNNIYKILGFEKGSRFCDFVLKRMCGDMEIHNNKPLIRI